MYVRHIGFLSLGVSSSDDDEGIRPATSNDPTPPTVASANYVLCVRSDGPSLPARVAPSLDILIDQSRLHTNHLLRSHFGGI